MLSDLDFADDIALLSKEIWQAQELLLRVEKSVGKVGLKMNAGKTKFMSFNSDNVTITTSNGTDLDQVTDCKYLGVWMASTEKEFKHRKAAAWRAYVISLLRYGSHHSLSLQAMSVLCHCRVCASLRL